MLPHGARLMVHHSRLSMRFSSHGTRCAAWLYVPRTKRPAPVIVMAPGLGATRAMGLPAHAERFAQAGYACLLFDYRHFGASGGEPRQLLDVRMQIEDLRVAIDCVRREPRVDGRRIIVWGTSLSAGHAIRAAVADGDISAVIAHGPCVDGRAMLRALGARSLVGLGARALADMAVGATGRMRVTVAVVGRRGSASLATSEDARAGYGDMAVPGSLFENRVTARGVVQLASYSPGRMARDLACPVLFCVGDRDGIAPARSTLHYARQAPRAEIMRYRANHFDLHRPPLFERVVGDQIAFLRRHLRQTGDGEAAAGPGAATIRPMAARRA